MDIFPNGAAVTRLAGAMMPEQNEKWPLNLRCMQPEGLRPLRDLCQRPSTCFALKEVTLPPEFQMGRNSLARRLPMQTRRMCRRLGRPGRQWLLTREPRL